jgi:hypothetical protein
VRIHPARVAFGSLRRYIPRTQLHAAGRIMRAEIERLVEEIKQSVGLLRRHL